MVPVVLSDADPEAKLRRLKREFGQSARGAEGRFDAKWKLKVHDTDEWASWLFLQQVERDLTAENFYILVRPPPPPTLGPGDACALAAGRRSTAYLCVVPPTRVSEC